MLMLIPITAESTAEDGVRFPLSSLLPGEHLRTESRASRASRLISLHYAKQTPSTCLDVESESVSVHASLHMCGGGGCVSRMVGATADFRSDLQATDSFFLPAVESVCAAEGWLSR